MKDRDKDYFGLIVTGFCLKMGKVERLDLELEQLMNPDNIMYEGYKKLVAKMMDKLSIEIYYHRMEVLIECMLSEQERIY